MRFAILVDNVVINVVDSDEALGDNWVQSDFAQMGQIYDVESNSYHDPVIVQQIPQKVTRRQGLLALVQTGNYEPLMTALNALEGTEKLIATIEFENHVWERDNELLNLMGLSIGLTVEDIDNLFLLAITL